MSYINNTWNLQNEALEKLHLLFWGVVGLGVKEEAEKQLQDKDESSFFLQCLCCVSSQVSPLAL